jgi:hypothetical protein
MAVYALLSGSKVVNTVVADTASNIGPLADLYEVVDVTNFRIQPNNGWGREDGIWYPPGLSDEAKALWTNDGFPAAAVEEIIEAEVVEKPKAISNTKTDSKKGK